MSQPASLPWLAGHGFRLGWRDWTSLMTAGGHTRARTATIALVAFAAFMHVFGFWTVASYANADLESETSALVGITGSLLLSWTALAASASWAALGTALVAFGVLGAVWLISPSRA